MNIPYFTYVNFIPMEINTFHLSELLKTSQIPMAKLSKLTWVTEPTLKAIKEWRKSRIYKSTFNSILLWYHKYLRDNMNIYNETSLYFNKAQWLQDNQ